MPTRLPCIFSPTNPGSSPARSSPSRAGGGLARAGMTAGPDYAIGCEIGITTIKVVTVTPSGEILSRTQTDTLAQDPQWPTRVRDLVAQIERESGLAKWLGVAAPGIAAPHGR